MAKRRYTVGKGVDKYLATLGNIDTATRAGIGKGIYAGAKVVADAIHEEIEALPATTERERKQKKGLLDGLGVTKIQDQGGVRDVKIGFDGYNEVVTKSYPKGQPNSMIARATISGTSFSRKNDFVGRALRKCREKAEEAMKQAIDKEIADANK